MVTLIISLLVLSSLLAIFYPILSSRISNRNFDQAYDHSNDILERRRERIYEELKVLEQERFLGHMTDEEYEVQSKRAQSEMDELLKQQDQISVMLNDIDSELESKITAKKLEFTDREQH